MKNAHIKAGQEVPIELRKEVYKEALELIENQNTMNNKFGWSDNWLCWLLPSLLWDNDMYNSYLLGTGFWHSETHIMFPELAEKLKYIELVMSNEQRIEFLKSVI